MSMNIRSRTLPYASSEKRTERESPGQERRYLSCRVGTGHPLCHDGQRRGYLNQNYELHTGPEEKNETYIVDFFLSPISKPVVIDNIFYDFDKATLRPESKKALDEMIKMLNDNPNVTIELGAHTDRKGTDQYNERLAQRRAQSVVDYLIAGGIEAARLEAKGYGESVPKTINKKMAKQFDFLKEGDVLTEEFILALPPEQQEIASLDVYDYLLNGKYETNITSGRQRHDHYRSLRTACHRRW